jgi:2-dehydro-3-deoxyglucarate aldolase/4-hydroxy-2-oxoheptanedioate aldolase
MEGPRRSRIDEERHGDVPWTAGTGDHERMTDPFDRSFRDRVLAGETLLGLFLDLASPASAENCAALGYDWLLIDLEHGMATEADLLGMLHAVEVGGSVPVVRPQSGERLRIGRALDMGAMGIMVPRLDTADQAREAVTFLRYPPAGIRGMAIRVRGAGLGVVSHADAHRLNDRIVGIVQVETTGGLEAAPETAAIDGVDVLFVGPADLTHSMGIPGQFDHPDYTAALERVVAACRTNGKAAGILIYDPDVARRLIEMGFSFVGIGADGAFAADGAKGALAAVRG